MEPYPKRKGCRITAPARVYHLLKRRKGRWHDGWDIAMAARTTCVSTRISEVRRRIAGTGEEIESARRKDKHGNWIWCYRIKDGNTKG
jgi:hypothetical protein